MNKTILFLGARGKGCQVSRIEEAFKKYAEFSVLDHNLFHLDIDYIFCNDAGYFEQAINLKIQSNGKTKIIMNVLDLFAHIQTPEANRQRIRIGEQIKRADVVTTIASYCVKEIKDQYNIDAKLIYNPIIPIERKNFDRFKQKPEDWKFLFVGRNCDPNRRVLDGLRAIVKFGFQSKSFISFGSENIGFGNYLGVISEERMNEEYNNCHFLLFPSYYSGLGLPVIEAIAGGMIPLCCSDMTTLEDILPEQLFPEYYSFKNVVSAEENIYRLFLSLYEKHNDENYESLLKRLMNHYNSSLRFMYSPESVANRVREVIGQL